MRSFTWTEEYSVGVKKFDLQHQQLFFYISELNDAMVSRLDHKMIADILKGLIQYTKSHFAEEEEQLARSAYPELEQHKVQHREFTRRALNFQMDFLAGKAELSADVMEFLMDWLTEHILCTDKSYSDYLS